MSHRGKFQGNFDQGKENLVRFSGEFKLSEFELSRFYYRTGAPNGNFRENICSEDDLRSRIFGAFVVKFLACLPFLGFSNIYKMV